VRNRVCDANFLGMKELRGGIRIEISSQESMA
jgi:hypothetical protein